MDMSLFASSSLFHLISYRRLTTDLPFDVHTLRSIKALLNYPIISLRTYYREFIFRRDTVP